MRKHKRKQRKLVLPDIPNKNYFSISEAALLCAVKPYVLRYWEHEFPQLNPTKRRGNRRFYQREDILIARQIRRLLYEDGFTIEGARAKLHPSLRNIDTSNMNLEKLITDLEGILQELKIQTAS
ncbi:MAG: hypothetical protein ACD_60C00068G0001 [uncultured bacterium]|nr:MAG: hypothetical protein ACD_60C00068G0001 [uncultured bacterium]HLB57523.1 MerR family transcriptional regulator [Gammaproteobacteria bacterium]